MKLHSSQRADLSERLAALVELAEKHGALESARLGWQLEQPVDVLDGKWSQALRLSCGVLSLLASKVGISPGPLARKLAALVARTSQVL